MDYILLKELGHRILNKPKSNLLVDHYDHFHLKGFCFVFWWIVVSKHGFIQDN